MLNESKTIEYKREFTEDIKKTVTAFANTDGGKIFIGINNEKQIVGLKEPDHVLLQVGNLIRDSIRPDVTLFTDLTISEQDGKPIVVIDVQRGTARPYYIAGKGIRPEGVYVRQGSATVPASESAILQMIKDTSGDSYENARSLNQNLSFDTATIFFNKQEIAFGESQKKSLRLIASDGTYTNLGLLLSEQCSHTIKIAVFEGDTKNIFKERREFTGSLLSQLEETYHLIDRFNSTRAEVQGLERIDKRDFPPEAVREALLNAIVHRDYSFSSSTQINVFSHCMEFVTVGGLVKGVALDDILLGLSILRNPNLANIFYRLRLIEAYGTGIPKIMDAYEQHETKPHIEVSSNAFKIVLPNINSIEIRSLGKVVEAIDEREKRILEVFKEKDSITRKDLETSEGLSQATAGRVLRKMVQKGLLEKAGTGKMLVYRKGTRDR